MERAESVWPQSSARLFVRESMRSGAHQRRTSCRELYSIVLPIPGQELIDLADAVIVDAREHVGKPRLRIDIVEARGLDQRVHHGGALAAAIGAGEQPRLAAERDTAQCTLGGIVGQTNPSVGEEACEGDPALEHIV